MLMSNIKGVKNGYPLLIEVKYILFNHAKSPIMCFEICFNLFNLCIFCNVMNGVMWCAVLICSTHAGWGGQPFKR